MRGSVLSLLAVAAAVAPLERSAAQDSNILFPVPLIEQRMREEPLVVTSSRGSRREEDRTQRVSVEFPDGTAMLVKMAAAGHGGSEFNNEPRYELAAYELQKLFLDEPEYVVPPTVVRAVPTAWLREHDPRAVRTFRGVESTVLVVQYWLFQVTPRDIHDVERFEQDPAYARHLANLNTLTYLIRHNDSNLGNFLISTDDANPRVFSVDNGVAFRSAASDRGYYWRTLRVDRLPEKTVERLRAVTAEDLERALAVLVQFEVRDGMLTLVENTENVDANRGVRNRDGVVQFGLTRAEIRDVENRLASLLQRVDRGRIATF